MPWYSWASVEGCRKNIVAYLVARYFGQFFKGKLTNDQLKLEILNGKASVEKINLDIQALNELGKKHNWPLEFVDGSIKKLNISLAWLNILTDPTCVEIDGLTITLQPKQQNEFAASMFESMWNSMTSSMKLAEEFAKQESMDDSNESNYEGIEIVANTINSIINKAKVTFTNTVIQLEHVPLNSTNGVGIVINIDLFKYNDDSESNRRIEEKPDQYLEGDIKPCVVDTYTTKKLTLEGITWSTVEFPSSARTFSRSLKKCENEAQTDSQYFDSSEESDQLKMQRHYVVFGKLFGEQEIYIFIKQNEETGAPKVSIDVKLRHLVMFLSPRQVHILLELCSGLCSPDSEDHSNISKKSTLTETPMTSTDYQKIESDLLEQIKPIHPLYGMGLQAVHGWSGNTLYTDTNEIFYPMKNSMNEMSTSNVSGISSSLDSSFSSSAPSTIFTEQSSRSSRRNRGHNIEIDPTAELSHFHIEISSLGIILLHEDLLNKNSVDNTLTLCSVTQMQNIANKFFSDMKEAAFLNSSDNTFEKTCEAFNNCCQRNHIRIIALPITFEAKERKTNSSFSITGNLEAIKLEILECLVENDDAIEIIPLLKFEKSLRPSFNISFKHVEKITKSVRKRNCPKTEISLNLGICSVELDVTIIERITCLLFASPVCDIKKNTKNIWEKDSLLPETKPTGFVRDLKILSSLINIKLRFPIPDFRSAINSNRMSWWKRYVRHDHLNIHCSDATFSTSFDSSQSHSEYTFQSKGINVYYNETEKGEPIHIAKIGHDEDYTDPSKIVFKIYPKNEQLDIEEPIDIMQQSFMTPSFILPTKNGPFTSKRVLRHSNTPHDKNPHEVEEMLLPGDKDEIDDFKKISIESTRTHVDISLSVIKMQLISKHIYELIYNRINNDLLVWQPNISSSKPKSYKAFSYMTTETENLFGTCRDGVQYESDSDSAENSEEDGAILFYSTYDKPKFLSSQVPMKQGIDKQSNLVINIHINHGIISFNTPARDSTMNVIPGQVGDFLLIAENAVIFFVSGYKGDEDLGYVCVHVDRGELSHNGMLPSRNIKYNFLNDTEYGENLQATIFKSEPGIKTETRKQSMNRDMITVACKIQSKHETHHVKTVKVSLGLYQSTLKHRMCTEPNSWVSQMLDFFNVSDYPISGYHSKEVLTELHLHMWECAIDYRPLYLPLRSVITIGSFSMTSHLSEHSNTSTLGFVAEDCNLFLSDKSVSKNGVASNSRVNLKRDYINIISFGLFELSLRTSDKNSKLHPHIDMRASNDCVHIYTCSDSARALTQLITYIATDGDLRSNENSDSAYSSPKHHSTDQPLINVEQTQDVRNLTESQYQEVQKLIAEAVTEPTAEIEVLETDNSDNGARLFFFPDEKEIASNKTAYKQFPLVVKELGDINLHNEDSSDDDFCFVEKETDLDYYPRNGIPEIKWLTTDPVRILENHFFVPLEKKDLLNTPDGFPMPKYKYTLCEMNIVWHMYGGNDFLTDSKKEGKNKTVEFADTKLNDVVNFSNKEKVVISEKYSPKSNCKLNWKNKGGINRNHNILMELELNKVKFQHEIYPEIGLHASRQVLLISELEIRDLLTNSEINKFLYQYTSESKPKQSQGHMILVKAVHIRPDKDISSEECCLRLSLLPLRLNIDQDSLKFLITFFSEIGQGPCQELDKTSISSKQNTPTHRPPIMTITTKKIDKKFENSNIDENLIILDPALSEGKSGLPEDKPIIDDSNQPVFFRNIVFAPDVHIKIDYQGKHVDVADGTLESLLIGLVMGLAQLNCSELTLKRISYRHGLLGLDKLINFLVQEWLADIKKNQLPSLLSGVGPMYSLIQLFQGVKDLFWMPIEQYQKDGRIVRGIQRGANSFTTSTAMAALELTTRIIHLIQYTAETAYDMLSPGPSVRKSHKIKGRKKRYNQPQDIREGVANAYWLVKEGIGETAGKIVQVASHEHEQKGYSGAVGGVLRQIPPTIIKPIIIATEATNNVLGGMKYQLIPDARNEANQKWKPQDI